MLKLFVIINILTNSSFADVGELSLKNKEPFWKAKDIYLGIVENRQIPVRADIDNGSPVMSIQLETAGLISTPMTFAYKKVIEFEKLPQVSIYFDEAKYYPEKQRLFLRLSGLGYHVQMIWQMKFTEEGDNKVIEWESIEGGFKGMKGWVRVSDYHHTKTEISFRGYYEALHLPLPKILMGLPLEIIGQKAAEKMRSFIEEEYKNDKPAKK